MALATTTGVAADHLALLDAIRVFALAQGWTVNLNTSVGSDQRLHISKSGVYINLYAGTWTEYNRDSTGSQVSTPGIAFYASTGFDGGEAWDAQPGAPDWGDSNKQTAHTNDIRPGPFAYRLVADSSPDYLYAIAEVDPGIYKHLLFGSLDKCGAWTGGDFCAGASWACYSPYINDGRSVYHSPPFDSQLIHSDYGAGPSHLRAESEWKRFWGTAGAGWHRAGSVVRAEVAGVTSAGDPNLFDLFRYALNAAALNGQTELSPLHVWAEKASGNWFYAGTVPGVRSVRMDALISGQVITIGSDDWLIVPLIQRNGASGTPNSYTEGLAYRIS